MPYNLFHKTCEVIERASNGEYPSVPNNLPRLSKETFGVQKEHYYLVGGSSGTGKTTFVISQHVYYPFRHCYLNGTLDDLKIIYISLEISPELLFMKLMSLHLYVEYKMIVPVSALLSRTKPLTERIVAAIEEQEEFFDALQKCLTVLDGKWTPKRLDIFLKRYANNNGSFKTVKKEGANVEVYTENNPKLVTQIILDHIGLLASGAIKKSIMDEVSALFVKYRNLCRFTPVVVQQFNRDSVSTDRAKVKQNHRVKLSDFSDTSNSAHDAEIIIGLMAPHKEEILIGGGYDVSLFQKNLIVAFLLKNRWGDADSNIGLYFKKSVGDMVELPKPKDVSERPELILPYNNWNKKRTKKITN